MADEKSLPKLVTAKQASDLHCSTLVQRILARYLADNDLDAHIAVIRAAYKAQRDLMGRQARELGEALDALRAGVCLAVDFPEEEVECLSPEDFAAGVRTVLDRIAALEAAHRRARPFREGVRAVLFGRVNAGKSSLFNALLGRNRALVADRPGTTRDFLEETIDLDGVAVTVTDTAGLRPTDDAVEQAGKALGM